MYFLPVLHLLKFSKVVKRSVSFSLFLTRGPLKAELLDKNRSGLLSSLAMVIVTYI